MRRQVERRRNRVVGASARQRAARHRSRAGRRANERRRASRIQLRGFRPTFAVDFLVSGGVVQRKQVASARCRSKEGDARFSHLAGYRSPDGRVEVTDAGSLILNRVEAADKGSFVSAERALHENSFAQVK